MNFGEIMKFPRSEKHPLRRLFSLKVGRTVCFIRPPTSLDVEGVVGLLKGSLDVEEVDFPKSLIFLSRTWRVLKGVTKWYAMSWDSASAIFLLRWRKYVCF